MSEEKAPYGPVPPVPNFAGGHATWKREQDQIIRALADHGVTIEHEVTHDKPTLRAEDNVTGLVDAFQTEHHYYYWTVDTPELKGTSYSFTEALGDIIDALKEAAKSNT